jgi:tight adherence protein C
MTSPIVILCGAAVFSASAAFLLWACPKGLLPRPQGGERGYRRARALREIPGFAVFEFLLRAMGHRLSLSPLNRLRAKLEGRLEDAGHPLGLSSDEFMGACFLVASAFASFGAVVASAAGKPPLGAATLAAMMGLVFPLFRLDELVRHRRLSVSRTLPLVIDLVALSMEAGLDFGRAVTEVESRLHPAGPMRFELEHWRHKLCLGWSRKDALEDLARRVPTEPVRQFVTAVLQGERRGTPLAQVLSVQAEVMRTKRSQAAEQAASRAGILILLPLLLIFSAVFVILLGPFVVKLLRGTLM